MSRTEYLSHAQWAFIEPLLPSVSEQGERPFRNNRRVVEGIVYRYWVGVPCLPNSGRGRRSGNVTAAQRPVLHSTGKMVPMSAHAGLLLAVAIPAGGLVVFTLVFFLLGRRMRRLRREGRVTYPAKTTPGSNDFSSNAV
ncbi:hypothetical protein [Rhodococcus sp. ACT016]|uniref:hypothetical protein n=1 Tax=Rhodococcus sp. ACT016 TaxID=3134808 RepID=UPI003D27DB31